MCTAYYQLQYHFWIYSHFFCHCCTVIMIKCHLVVVFWHNVIIVLPCAMETRNYSNVCCFLYIYASTLVILPIFSSSRLKYIETKMMFESVNTISYHTTSLIQLICLNCTVFSYCTSYLMVTSLVLILVC